MAVVLPDELKAAIGSSRADGFPILWPSVDETSQPTIAIYSSTHVHSDHELGIWLRTEDRGFLSRTGKNAKVFGWFRNTTTNVGCQIVGEARRVDHPATRDQIYRRARVRAQDGRGQGWRCGDRGHRPRHAAWPCDRFTRLTEASSKHSGGAGLASRLSAF